MMSTTSMTAAALQHRSIYVAGIHSPVLESGPPEAEEAVVFVHGNPGSSQDWIDLMRRTSPFARAVALDMPGFGQADKPSDFDYTVKGYARHLGDALRVLGVRRAHLVLHDFGGPWGLTWAADHPDQVASLTLINIGVLLSYRWHYLAKIWRTPLLGEVLGFPPTRWAANLLLRHGNPHGLPSDLVDRMYASLKDRATQRAILKLYRATNDPARYAEMLAAELRPLNLSVLVVWGRHDPYIPVRLAERQREIFLGAQVVILEESGHWPFADNPEGVAAAVLPFLRRQFNYAPAPPAAR